MEVGRYGEIAGWLLTCAHRYHDAAEYVEVGREHSENWARRDEGATGGGNRCHADPPSCLGSIGSAAHASSRCLRALAT